MTGHLVALKAGDLRAIISKTNGTFAGICLHYPEHPELIAERILRFAKLVGRENVMAGADCGFSSQATYKTEVHPTIVWEKFKAMRQGATIASKALWDNRQKLRRPRGQHERRKRASTR